MHSAKTDFIEADSVACLGPTGTYSEDATIRLFGNVVRRQLLNSLDEVVKSCENGQVSHCVIAIENTTEGAVPRALDLLFNTELVICGEVSLDINHNLLSSSGTLDGVVCVRAHAQALAQCHGWLTANAPQLKREAVLSNAEAARMAHLDPTSSAIASARSATEQAVEIVAKSIQDDPNNKTRFFALSRNEYGAQDCELGRTSLIVSVPNVAGALYRIVEPFARHGVSMSRFESRPVKSGNWEYNFYIDVVGGSKQQSVATAIAELQGLATVKVLGSYFDYN